MISQLGQVLATYWRRAISRAFTAGAAIIPVIAIVGIVIGLSTGEVKEKEQTGITLTWIGMLGFYSPILIAIHFKQQIVQIDQRRIPSAATAHVTVVVGLLALCCVGLPAALMAIGIWSWGALGLTVALTAVTFAVFVLQGGFALLAFPLIFVGLAVALSPVQHWLEELFHGRHEVLGLLLAAAGVGGVALALVRLLRMTEEDIGYPNIYDVLDLNRCDFSASPIGIYAHRCSSAEAAPARMGIWKLLGWLGWTLITLCCRLSPEREVPSWPQWSNTSIWQRSRLRWLVCGDSFPLWPSTAFFLMLFSFMYITMPGRPSYSMVLNALFMTFYPVFSVTGTMSRQRKVAGIELLRPVGRSQYLMEMGLAYAGRVPVTWIQFSIAWILPGYLFTDSPVWSHQMLNLLVLTAASQVFFFGLAVWLMRYAIPFFTWTVLSLGLYLAMIFAVTSCIPFVDWRTTSLDALLWVSPGILAAGALITWDAYRRWMQTELG